MYYSGEVMKTIEIEDDLYKYILNNIEAFGETPSQILRRLLISAEAEKETTQASENETLKTTKVELSPVEVAEKLVVEKSIIETSVPHENSEADNKQNSTCKKVEQLLDDPEFMSESVITNKFMMMLQTMYFEKTAEFIDSAEKIKGRTRDYLGTNLTSLLNSDNEEELAQFKASKPREIPQTPYWVITNTNTGRKRIILTQMMASMGYPHHLIERIKEKI